MDGLELIERFVNTRDVETGADAIAGWTDEVERVTAFREALRALLLAHHGEPADPAAIARLREEGARVPLVVAFDDGGASTLAPAGSGADALIGRLLAVIARAEAEGTWERMKVCPADDCLWAFYDRSRNRSRTWCSMASCGNRAKARAFRAAHKR